MYKRQVPTMFYQHYTFHGTVNNQAYPFMFGLCKRKTEQMHGTLFVHLKNTCRTLNYNLKLKTILTNFELAVMNAVRAAFLTAAIIGFLF